jgi:gliding motility-associated-like protein
MRGYTETTPPVVINPAPVGNPSINITSTATSTPICTPISFDATATDTGAGPSFQWEVSGVKVGDGSLHYSNNLFANGDEVYCILTTATGCDNRLIADTSNIITLAIDPRGAATVAITSAPSIACGKQPISFTATVTNGAAQPALQWLVNGIPVPGDNSTAYTSDTLQNGDVVYCQITSDDACGLAKSNSIPVIVENTPVIPPGQIFNIVYGKSLVLEPVIEGDAATWLWTPAAGLSDPTIANPIASPPTTTTYLLKVTSAHGCSDSNNIIVYVYTPASMPNAFTPNGDGHNDIFYMLGAPLGSRIIDFSIYDRWGQKVFQVHDAMPGDPAGGWNGYINGRPAPSGTYPYELLLQNPDGRRRLFRSTVVLIR